MSEQGGEAEGDEAISKEHDGKRVLSDAEGDEEVPRDPNLEEPTVPGAEARAGPPDKGTREEQDENLQESQWQEPPSLAEKPLEKKKPSINLLEAIRMRNARGLEQDHTLLGPGTMIHVKWSDAFKKENQSPWDTPWGYIRLTEEAQVSKPPEKAAWNWTHPTKPDIAGHSPTCST